MTKIQGLQPDRSDADVVIARVVETYNLEADGNRKIINNLGIVVPYAGDYLIEGLALVTVNALIEATVEVALSSGALVADFTVNDPDNALDQVQIENHPSTISLAQGQHAWRVTGTVFGIEAGGTISMKMGQANASDPFLVLRGGFLRLTKLT